MSDITSQQAGTANVADVAQSSGHTKLTGVSSDCIVSEQASHAGFRDFTAILWHFIEYSVCQASYKPWKVVE